MEKRPWWLWPLLPVLLAAAVALLFWLVAAVLLLLVVWTAWGPRGRRALVVYSNSPIWQEYFEHQVLPELGDRAVVLNWSDRARWPLSLPVALFRMFAGTREFNPLAIVFRPFAWPRRFRFYGPFQAYKHGRAGEVDEMRRRLLNEFGPRPVRAR
jgi:hypothetical protein